MSLCLVLPLSMGLCFALHIAELEPLLFGMLFVPVLYSLVSTTVVLSVYSGLITADGSS